MKRWTARRALVGAVAITLSIAARSARAQSLVGAPVMVRVEPESLAPRIAVRPPPQWQVVQTPSSAWRVYLSQQRATQIARLRVYAQNGVFPLNRVRPGRVNVFVDPSGRLCAVANLMALSGHRTLVDRVAQSNNFLQFRDVSSGPLADWALSSGLTREELIRIQEPYSFIPANVPQNIAWQAEQAERARLQAHFAMVLQELEFNTDRSLDVAVSRLGSHLYEAPHDLGWDGPVTPQPIVEPVLQPVVYPTPVVQPVPFAQPYAQPLVVFPEPVRRPVRVDPYAQPVLYPTPQPVVVTPVAVEPSPVIPVVTQPLQVHVNVHVQANPSIAF
jgi:hypothetical protein